MWAPFQWLLGGLIAALEVVGNLIVDGVNAVASWFIGVLYGIFEWAWGYISSWIPAEWYDAFASFPFDELFSYWGDVAWILPVNESLAIIFTTFGISATIRLIRHIIGWVPTIEG